MNAQTMRAANWTAQPIRELWTQAHRARRVAIREGQPLNGETLFRTCAALVGCVETYGPGHWDATRLYSALEKMGQPMPGRYDSQRSILNGFGSWNGWRSPPMESPRFNRWRELAHRSSRLRDRLVSRGMVDFEPGNYVTGLLRMTPRNQTMKNVGAILRAGKRSNRTARGYGVTIYWDTPRGRCSLVSAKDSSIGRAMFQYRDKGSDTEGGRQGYCCRMWRNEAKREARKILAAFAAANR